MYKWGSDLLFVFAFVLTAQSHLLRKVVDPTTGRLYLGLFLYLADNTQVIGTSNCIYTNTLILPLKMWTVSSKTSSYSWEAYIFLKGCVLKFGGCFACGGYFWKEWCSYRLATGEFHQLKEKRNKWVESVKSVESVEWLWKSFWR